MKAALYTLAGCLLVTLMVATGAGLACTLTNGPSFFCLGFVGVGILGAVVSVVVTIHEIIYLVGTAAWRVLCQK